MNGQRQSQFTELCSYFCLLHSNNHLIGDNGLTSSMIGNNRDDEVSPFEFEVTITRGKEVLNLMSCGV